MKIKEKKVRTEWEYEIELSKTIFWITYETTKDKQINVGIDKKIKTTTERVRTQ